MHIVSRDVHAREPTKLMHMHSSTCNPLINLGTSKLTSLTHMHASKAYTCSPCHTSSWRHSSQWLAVKVRPIRPSTPSLILAHWQAFTCTVLYHERPAWHSWPIRLQFLPEPIPETPVSPKPSFRPSSTTLRLKKNTCTWNTRNRVRAHDRNLTQDQSKQHHFHECVTRAHQKQATTSATY